MNETPPQKSKAPICAWHGKKEPHTYTKLYRDTHDPTNDELICVSCITREAFETNTIDWGIAYGFLDELMNYTVCDEGMFTFDLGAEHDGRDNIVECQR